MPNFAGANRDNRERYGNTHQRARRLAFAALPEYSLCARCHRVMWKHAKDRLGRSALHYDHNDARNGYLGFSHRDCNIRAGAAQGGRVANARRAARRHLRPWQSRAW